MPYPQCNQNIRLKIGAHMCVQIRMEFAVVKNIGFNNRLCDAEAVILRLAHQGFGNGGDRGFHLHTSVGKNIGDLCVSHPENIQPAVCAVNITGNHSPDYLQALFIISQRKITEFCKIGNQVPAVMVRRPQHIVKSIALQKEINDDILFLIQIKLTKQSHRILLLKKEAGNPASSSACEVLS